MRIAVVVASLLLIWTGTSASGSADHLVAQQDYVATESIGPLGAPGLCQVAGLILPGVHVNSACFPAGPFAGGGTYRFAVVDDSGSAVRFHVQPLTSGPVQPFQPLTGCGTMDLTVAEPALVQVAVKLLAPNEQCSGQPSQGTVRVFSA